MRLVNQVVILIVEVHEICFLNCGSPTSSYETHGGMRSKHLSYVVQFF